MKHRSSEQVKAFRGGIESGSSSVSGSYGSRLSDLEDASRLLIVSLGECRRNVDMLSRGMDELRRELKK